VIELGVSVERLSFGVGCCGSRPVLTGRDWIRADISRVYVALKLGVSPAHEGLELA